MREIGYTRIAQPELYGHYVVVVHRHKIEYAVPDTLLEDDHICVEVYGVLDPVVACSISRAEAHCSDIWMGAVGEVRYVCKLSQVFYTLISVIQLDISTGRGVIAGSAWLCNVCYVYRWAVCIVTSGIKVALPGRSHRPDQDSTTDVEVTRLRHLDGPRRNTG